MHQEPPLFSAVTVTIEAVGHSSGATLRCARGFAADDEGLSTILDFVDKSLCRIEALLAQDLDKDASGDGNSGCCDLGSPYIDEDPR